MRSNFQNLDPLGVEKGIKKGLKSPKIEKTKGSQNFMKIDTQPILTMVN